MSITTEANLIFYKEVVLPPFSITNITIESFVASPENGFGILQVHSHLYDVSLAHNLTLSDKQFYESGTNLGFTIYPKGNGSRQIRYIHNNHYFTNVSASIIFIRYNTTSPIPGACNMEYNVEEAPILMVTSEKDLTFVETPLSSTSRRSGKSCNQTNLQYLGYHLYLRHNDFSGTITKMFNLK